MNVKLYNTLIDRNLINEDVVVTARYSTHGFHSGVFNTTKEMMWDPRMSAECVLAVEGMEPERYAKSYNIKSDGSTNKYKKRGRKPKQIA